MHNDEPLTPEIQQALDSFHWIKEVTQPKRKLFTQLRAVATPPRQHTLYETQITDQEVLLTRGTLKPVPGLQLQLSGVGTPQVAIGGTVLGDGDFRFAYSDDVLSLMLNLDSQRGEGPAGLYKFGRIQFSPSGQTFNGMINQICPGQFVTYQWEGTLLRKR